MKLVLCDLSIGINTKLCICMLHLLNKTFKSIVYQIRKILRFIVKANWNHKNVYTNNKNESVASLELYVYFINDDII